MKTKEKEQNTTKKKNAFQINEKSLLIKYGKKIKTFSNIALLYM